MRSTISKRTRANRALSGAAGRGGDAAHQLALGLDLPAPPELRPLRPWEAMIADYGATGLTTGPHPLLLMREGLHERGAVTSADLGRLPHGSTVRIGGLVVARQRPGTAKGVCFMLLEDEHGTVNLIVPPDLFERRRLVGSKLSRFIARESQDTLYLHLQAVRSGQPAQPPQAFAQGQAGLGQRHRARGDERHQGRRKQPGNGFMKP